ncbi:MAG: DUF1800 domain-containing protein [Chitinophagaceae bacterium]|nr:DUF1800 domain-containing protein [Chitinophagaceae bacterium]
MSLSTRLKNQHLLWRAGFGPAVEQLNELSLYSPQQYYQALVKASANEPVPLEAVDDYLKGFFQGMGDVIRMQTNLSDEERKKFRQKNRQGVRNLNLLWFKEMVNSSAQLREKMALFWHGHFACRNLNVLYQQQLLHILRKYGLGSFRTLLHEVSKSAAMLNFLNNQQNRKDHPNENFAREVMELFTLGRGHYSENDIKEAARAFTGWGANLKGEFVFRKFQHDFGKKTFLNRTGNFDGEDILNILLEQKQTARFITRKIYSFFVNDNPDDEKTEWLARRFYQSDYNISKLMEDIFTSDWFYESRNIGCKIKSPVELLVGMQRLLPMKIENETMILVLQRLLGQVLFFPPNVAGWPGGKNWIDSSTLLLRMRLPAIFMNEEALNVQPKPDDDQMMGQPDAEENILPKNRNLTERYGKALKAEIRWDEFLRFYQNLPKEKLIISISETLLQAKTNVPVQVIYSFSKRKDQKDFIKAATLYMMSLPEYQLC